MVTLLLGSGDSSKSGADNASAGGANASKHGSRSGAHGRSGGGSGGGSSAAATGGSGTGQDTLKGTALLGHGPKGTESVPILMYHVINPPPAGAKFPGLYVDPEEFEAQMEALKRAGFHAVTMDQMLANWTRGAPLPEGKPIVVSFDNGYQSQLTKALPVLDRLGWVGVENIQLTGLPPSQGGLSRGQVEQLAARRLGAGHARHKPCGPDHARREGVARTGGGRTRRGSPSIQGAGQLVLLPVGALQRDGHRGCEGGGLRGLDDCGAGLGEPH